MENTSTRAGSQAASGRFGMTWIIAVAVGFVLGLAVGLPASWVLSEALLPALGETTAGVLSIVTFSAIFGLAVGGAQVIALRKHLAHPIGWLLGSVLGSIVPVILLLALFALVGDRPLPEATEAMGLVAGGLIGLGMGIGQWLAARSLSPRIAWWPVVSAAGLLTGWVTAFGLAGDNLAAPAVILGGVLAAAITALGMRWLLRG